MSTTSTSTSPGPTPPDAAPPATGETGAKTETQTKAPETPVDAKAEAPKAEPPKAEPPKAEPPKADDATESRIRALEERAAKAERAAQRNVKAAYLSGLVNPELLDLVPDIELGADGQLSAAGRSKLDAWKAARPQYFGVQADAGERTTPSSRRQFSDAETARLKAAGVDTTGKRGRTLAMLSGGMN